MHGTYRRNYEGDFLCTSDEVQAMYADRSDLSADSKIVKNLDINALNMDTLKSYRIRFGSLHTTHPWNHLQNDEFLLKLTALKRDENGKVHPTIAGLLMFGDADSIIQALPNYYLDYREESNDKNVRWLYRTTSDEGDWSGNIYDFFYKIINRVDDDIAVPFVNRIDHARPDETPVHEALHELVANALAHADYYGRQGIVIIKNHKKISVSNPGTLRITKEEFFAGGYSDPRNPLILKMFNRINIGERAGSGIDKILTAWRDQDWKMPIFDVSLRPERITVRIEVGQIKYIPGAFDLSEKKTEKGILKENSDMSYNLKKFASKELSKEEIVIDYIKKTGSIHMDMVMRLCAYKSRTSARNLIKKLIANNQIIQVGNGKSTKYILKY